MRHGQIGRIPPKQIAKLPPVVEPRMDGPSATRFDNED